jgi:anti-sigma regulatory factor (Ser/Thr protein kinase)
VATAAEFAVPGDIDDDMAILVVKSSPAELASMGRSFPAEPIMVSEARRLAAQTFRSWGMDAEQVDLACLLVSEVVTNAVLHASITPSPGQELDFDLDPVIMTAPVGAPRVSARPRGRRTAVKAAAGSARTAAVPVQGWDGPDPLGPGTPATGRTGAREFALRLRRGANSVWVEVFDPDLRLPRIRTAADTDEGGRGLYLVEQLATRWGSRPTPEGKAVWFEMPRSGYRP